MTPSKFAPVFLLSDGTRIDDNEYLETATELVAYTEEQIRKLQIYFEIKRFYSQKHLLSLSLIHYDAWLLLSKESEWLFFSKQL